MREIKFRGKTANCEWVYGSLVHSKNIQPAIYFEFGKGTVKTFDFVYVRPETVGQYTGLHDKNGVEIYEGDIFTSDYFDDTYNFEVVFSDGAFCGKHKSTGIYMLGFTNFDDNGEDLGYWCEEDYTSHIQIIGNIHDNPKLLS